MLQQAKQLHWLEPTLVFVVIEYHSYFWLCSCLCQYSSGLCSSLSLVPTLPNLFNMHEKRGGARDLTSRDKSWHDVMKERRSTTIDFESVHQLQFIIHGSLKPSRILLHSLEGFGTISSIHVELERLKVWFAHAQFSHLTTLDTGYVTHVTLETRLPLVFQRATLKNWEEPGDEAILAYNSVAHSDFKLYR